MCSFFILPLKQRSMKSKGNDIFPGIKMSNHTTGLRVRRASQNCLCYLRQKRVVPNTAHSVTLVPFEDGVKYMTEKFEEKCRNEKRNVMPQMILSDTSESLLRASMTALASAPRFSQFSQMEKSSLGNLSQHGKFLLENHPNDKLGRNTSVSCKDKSKTEKKNADPPHLQSPLQIVPSTSLVPANHNIIVPISFPLSTSSAQISTSTPTKHRIVTLFPESSRASIQFSSPTSTSVASSPPLLFCSNDSSPMLNSNSNSPSFSASFSSMSEDEASLSSDAQWPDSSTSSASRSEVDSSCRSTGSAWLDLLLNPT